MSALLVENPGGPHTPLTVAVLAGGRSNEHDVSLASGAAVRDGLRTAGHEVVWVQIGRDGVWRTDDGEPLSVTPGGGLLGVDVVFPALHGPYGEDGTVQGLLETLDVAYIGAGVTASAVCLDKVLFKRLMSALRIPQVRYVGVSREQLASAREHTLAEIAGLGMPVFVKPAHMGSSLGIVRVSDDDGVPEALEQAFTHDESAIVEATASGKEVECGILGTAVSEPGEIVIEGEWYDFDAKYTPGGMQLLIPARISAGAREQVKRLALGAFLATGCEGLARADFFVASSPEGDGERVLLNELNTMPGFTPTSVYARLLESSGVPYPRLLDRLCRLALDRHAQRRAPVT